MSVILEKVRRGLPLDDILVIDGHCHIGLWHNFNVPRLPRTCWSRWTPLVSIWPA